MRKQSANTGREMYGISAAKYRSIFYIYTHFLCSLVKTFLVGLFFAPSPAAPGDNRLHLCPTATDATGRTHRSVRSPNRTAAHHRICRSTASRSPVLTRGGICVPPTVVYLPYRVSGSTRRRAFSVAGPMAWNSLPDFIPRAAQTALGVYCS